MAEEININESFPDFQDSHDFHPHITLARISYVNDKKVFLKKIKEINVKKIISKIESFILYKSTLTKTGSVYEKVFTFMSIN